jgi:hypothetical protein
MENNMESPLKTKNTSVIRSSNTTPGIYPEEFESGYYKGICTPMFIPTLFIIAKLWKQPKCLTTDKKIKKM